MVVHRNGVSNGGKAAVQKGFKLFPKISIAEIQGLQGVIYYPCQLKKLKTFTNRHIVWNWALSNGFQICPCKRILQNFANSGGGAWPRWNQLEIEHLCACAKIEFFRFNRPKSDIWRRYLMSENIIQAIFKKIFDFSKDRTNKLGQNWKSTRTPQAIRCRPFNNCCP